MSHVLLSIGSLIITLILLVIIVYGVFDGKTRIHKRLHHHKCRNLTFSDYVSIVQYPEKYSYHAPYGVENALITFNSEAPYILDVVATCIERNRHLIKRYENNEDPEVLNAFLKIELQLTTMIANQGISLTNRCRFYCNNTSKSFDLDLDKDIVENFVKTASKMHMQFSVLQNEVFKSDEVVRLSNSMYSEFYEFFKNVNDLIYIYVDKKYNNDEKEESNND